MSAEPILDSVADTADDADIQATLQCKCDKAQFERSSAYALAAAEKLLRVESMEAGFAHVDVQVQEALIFAVKLVNSGRLDQFSAMLADGSIYKARTTSKGNLDVRRVAKREMASGAMAISLEEQDEFARREARAHIDTGAPSSAKERA